MRIIIAGSRSIQGDSALHLIDKAIKKCGWQIDEVISGDARGVDTAAIEWAKKNFIDYVIMPANWKKYSKAAGYKRNQKMAWYARIIEERFNNSTQDCPDKYKGGLIAIWDGKSSGTKHMIDIANEMGLEVEVFKTSCSQESLQDSE